MDELQIGKHDTSQKKIQEELHKKFQTHEMLIATILKILIHPKMFILL